MIIDLLKLRKPTLDFELEFQPKEVDLETEFAELTEPVEFNGKLRKKDLRAEIEGEILTVVNLSCDRCLSKVQEELEIGFENAFVKPENYTDDQEIELEIKDLEVSILEDDRIDLREIAREQILLALPNRVYCRENCLGLCEKCGANLNQTDCKCKKDDVDPRWSALEKLKIKN
jgi:uncharacterized protein